MVSVSPQTIMSGCEFRNCATPWRSSGGSSKIRMRVFTECFSGADMYGRERCAIASGFLPFVRTQCQAANCLRKPESTTKDTKRWKWIRIRKPGKQELKPKEWDL